MQLSPMHPVHRLIFCLLLGISATLASLFGERTRWRRNAGTSQAAVPVTVGQRRQKEMPLDVNVVGTVEAFSTVAVRAQVTGELKAVNFRQGEDVQAGQVLFTLDHRPLEAALNQAEANLQRDTAQAANAKVIAQRMDDLVERGVGTREQRDTARTTAAALEAVVGANTRRRRERQSSAAVRHDSRADLRTHGRAHGERGQPRPRKRSVAARRHQSGQPDLRVVRRSRGAASRLAPLHGDTRPPGRGASAQRRDRAGDGPHHVRRQPGRSDDRHDPDQGHIPELQSPALARAVRQCRGEAHLRSAGARRAVGRRAGRPGGPVRLRREGRSDGGDAAGRRGAHGGHGNGLKRA